MNIKYKIWEKETIRIMKEMWENDPRKEGKSKLYLIKVNTKGTPLNPNLSDILNNDIHLQVYSYKHYRTPLLFLSLNFISNKKTKVYYSYTLQDSNQVIALVQEMEKTTNKLLKEGKLSLFKALVDQQIAGLYTQPNWELLDKYESDIEPLIKEEFLKMDSTETTQAKLFPNKKERIETEFENWILYSDGKLYGGKDLIAYYDINNFPFKFLVTIMNYQKTLDGKFCPESKLKQIETYRGSYIPDNKKYINAKTVKGSYRISKQGKRYGLILRR